MLFDKIKVNSELPFEKSFKKDKLKWEFWDESYECNNEYLDARDANGNKILTQFECESVEDYRKRKQITTPRNYCQFVINKYNSSVFLNSITRPDNLPESIEKNTDGLGKDINIFFADVLKDAQIFSKSYVLLDVNPDSQEFYLRKIEIEDILVNQVNGKLLEAIVVLEDNDGKSFARYFNSDDFADITLNDAGRVSSISPLAPHGYSNIPVSVCNAEFGESSQISPIAESQKQIANYLSLLNQEIVDSTFTKWVVSGIRLPENDDNNSVIFSGKRMIVFEEQSATLQKIGADVSQADSISKRIQEEEQSIFRVSGLSSNSWSTAGAVQQMSGISRRLSMVDFFQICSRLRLAVQHCENYLLKLISETLGYEYIPSEYSTNYIDNDFSGDISELRDILSLDLPQVIKNRAILDFLKKNYTISDEEKKIIIDELQKRVGVP